MHSQSQHKKKHAQLREVCNSVENWTMKYVASRSK